MSNEIQIFQNKEFGTLRTVVKNGEPWFIAKDVCEMFKDSNRSRTMQSLDDDEKGYTQMTTPGGTQNFAIVSESGLYSMLFAMQPQKARGVSEEYITKRSEQLKRFKRWVTHDVIPSIRKHGAYATPATLEKMVLSPEFGIKVFTALKDEQEKRKAAEAQIEADKPKVVFADSVGSSRQSILVREMSTLLKQNGIDTGEKRLYSWLRANGYLIRKHGDDYNLPTQYSMDLGLMIIRERTYTDDVRTRITRTPMITGKGQQYFIGKFLAKQSAQNFQVALRRSARI